MSGTGAFGMPPGGGFPGGGPGLDALGGVHRAFVEALRAAVAGPSGPARPFEAFAARFFGTVPGASMGGPGPWPGVFGAAPAPAAPALGPTREHQRRLARLQAAVGSLVAAQQAQAALLSTAGAAAGAEFIAAVAARDLGADGLRATFDAWIECAEAAWQRLAHSAEWCAAQARTFDAALEVRAAQQAITDDAARLAGLPTLRDVDAAHRRLRDLERAAREPVAAPRAPAAPRKRGTAKSKPKRTPRK